MSESQEPETGIQPESQTQENPADEQVVHLPEQKTDVSAVPDTTPEEKALRFRPFDVVLAALVVVSAFLLAAFAIRNHDFWLHLASGRYLVQNLGGLWTDPFTYTAGDALWVNHNWLYEMLVYGIYNMAGGAGAAVSKAILIALLAIVMLKTRDKKGSIWVAVVFTGIAMVAMSLRFLYQPFLLSILLLSVTLMLLLRAPDDTGTKKPFRYLWLLPPLFVLWVNLDGWFVLGPFLVGIFALGSGIQALLPSQSDAEQKALRSARVKTLGLVFVGGLLACLINPYFHNAFRLPLELSYLLLNVVEVLPESLTGGGAALHALIEQEPAFGQSFSRPLMDKDYTDQVQSLRNIPGICHVILLIGGLLSFVALLVAGPDESEEFPILARFLVWLGFAILSVLMLRLQPLFAVAGAPIAAMNWSEAARRIAPHLKLPPRLTLAWSIGGRILVFGLLIFLIILVWPGWMRGRWGTDSSLHRVNLSVSENPALKETAQLVGQWKKEGKLENVFNLQPDIGCYIAWFSEPGVKYALDYRFDLFRHNSALIAKTRKSLLWPSDPPKNKKQKEKLDKIRNFRNDWFKKNNVTHVVFGWSSNPDAAAPVVHQLWDSPFDELKSAGGNGPPAVWKLAGGNGQTTVWRWWSSPAEATQNCHKQVGVNFAAAAFGKKQSKPIAETTGVLFPEPSDFWVKYLRGSEPHSAEVFKVGDHIGSYRHQVRQVLMQHAFLYHNSFATLNSVGYWGSGLPLTPFCGNLFAPVSLAQIQTARYQQTITDESAVTRERLEFPILALRSARKVVKENPRSAISYLLLAQAVANQWIVEQAHSDPNPRNRQLANYILTGGNHPRENRMLQLQDYWIGSAEPLEYSKRYTYRRNTLIAAYQQAILLDPIGPSAQVAHSRLAKHFVRGYFPNQELKLYFYDEAAHHAARHKELLLGKEPSFQNKAEKAKYDQLSKQLSANQRELARTVRDRRSHYRLQFAGLPLKRRILSMLIQPFKTKKDGKEFQSPMGLGGDALRELNKLNLNNLPDPDKSWVVIMKIQLLTGMGKMKEVFDVWDAHQEKLLPEIFNRQTGLQLAAAMGNYGVFEKEVSKIVEEDRKAVTDFFLPKALPMEMAGFKHPMNIMAFFFRDRQPMRPFPLTLADMHLQMSMVAGASAEMQIMQGLMALEAGDVVKAESHFASAAAVSKRFGSPPQLVLAEIYLNQIQRANAK